MRISKRKLDHFLSSATKEELIQQLMDLVSRFENVEEYYQTKLNRDIPKILDKYKKEITDALYPDGEWKGGFDLEAVEKTIKKYEKMGSPLASVISLKLFAIKSASELADAFGGDYGENFYIFFEEIYEEMHKDLKENGQLNNYKEQLKSVIEEAFEGYGHRDQLMDVYKGYFR